ncbi:MAG: hypothetical protein ACI8W8_001927 [Rhodothermales bacterium]|jgi:hypothetical protein
MKISLKWTMIVAIFAFSALAQTAEEKLAAAEAEIARLRGLVQDLGGDPDAESVARAPERPVRWSSSMHMLYPSAVTVPKKSFYGRIIHISKDTLETKANGNRSKTEALHNGLGLDSEVRIGIGAGLGLTDRLEVFGQRSVGREIQTGITQQNFGGFVADVPDISSFDTYDLLLKYQWLDEYEDGLNLALIGGTSVMIEDDETMTPSLDLGIVAERSFFDGRIYLGSGLLYASQSDFNSSSTSNANAVASKRHPHEEDNILSRSDGDNHTVALPLTLRLALTPSIHVYAEAVSPVASYRTGGGPSLAVGARMLKLHHGHFVAEYNVFATNTSNTAFNSSITGGYRKDALDIFGFSISVRY